MSDAVIVLRGGRHVVWECRTCGCVATCPEAVYDEHRAEGGFHFCPTGHQWGWTKENCEREKLRRERDRLKQQLAQKDDEMREATRAADRRVAEANERVAKADKNFKRLAKRAAGGVCPCCNRTFANMTRHMAHKHPDFGDKRPIALLTHQAGRQ